MQNNIGDVHFPLMLNVVIPARSAMAGEINGRLFAHAQRDLVSLSAVTWAVDQGGHVIVCILEGRCAAGGGLRAKT